MLWDDEKIFLLIFRKEKALEKIQMEPKCQYCDVIRVSKSNTLSFSTHLCDNNSDWTFRIRPSVVDQLVVNGVLIYESTDELYT